MKILLVAFVLCVSTLASAERLTFTRSFSTSDSVCCGDLSSSVEFKYTYIFDDVRNKSARGECRGFWDASTLELTVSDSINFDIEKARVFKAEFADRTECLWQLKEISKTNPDSPFVFDSSLPLSVFGETTEVKWIQK